MGASYEIWVCTDLGQRLELINYDLVKLQYVKKVNGIGWFNLTYGSTLDPSLLAVDRQIQIWRRPASGTSLSLDFLGFLRFWRHNFSKNVQSVTLAGPDQNELLKRRIVAYASGITQATMNSAADDAMKDIFDENYLATATDANREIQDNDVTVQADSSDGATITKHFAWQSVYKVMSEVSEASRTAGTEVFFEVAVTGIDSADNRAQLQFQTSTGQPGRDLTWDSGVGNPVIFGPEFGNVDKASFEYDWREEQNYIYAAGEGERSERQTAEASDSSRIGLSVWNRREGFRDARHMVNITQLQDEADTRLAEMRPKKRFEASLLDTQQARYGLDWSLGDKVTVRAFGDQFDGIIRQVAVKLSGGKEDIDVKVEDEST